MLTVMLIVACGPGLVFAIGSLAIFRPGGCGLIPKASSTEY